MRLLSRERVVPEDDINGLFLALWRSEEPAYLRLAVVREPGAG
jgi:hypothetical protein